MQSRLGDRSRCSPGLEDGMDIRLAPSLVAKQEEFMADE
jgi:hypothetical protein